MSRYVPSRHYFKAGLLAWVLAAFSGWVGLNWSPALVAMGLFLLTSGLMIYLGLRPPVEIRERHLVIGRLAVPWESVRRVDRTGWLSPLVVWLTLADDTRIRLVYPGDLDSANSLLRHLRRNAREALIDGVTYRQFWGEPLPPSPEAGSPPQPRYRLLCPEDEAEVERLYQRLKTVGHLDPRSSADEK